MRCGRSCQVSPPAVRIINASNRDAVRLSDWPFTNLISTMLPGLANSSPPFACKAAATRMARSEEHTSELQSLMRISYAVFCLKKKKTPTKHTHYEHYT